MKITKYKQETEEKKTEKKTEKTAIKHKIT